ncbi:unnamed protein product [Acanthoscelides obtectus]|uniref:Uncharacterized protein n=1 Tax=Acanthoscelides obtectus TaxID=200917 RepID=A0A9P0MHF7_ACAOB|nr:unnamed protein product [Acanthoscelides obtectus]CAK1646642.1 hypothetical protein AOBTE_LOCUS14775 [Acanthoscelides obtectus]
MFWILLPTNKRIEGGPFGDTAYAKKLPEASDYVILMLQNDVSNSSEDSGSELYSLRNDYIEKLNILRQRLNLIELQQSRSNECSGGCKITEIHDVDPQPSTSTPKNAEKEAVVFYHSQQTEVEEQYFGSHSAHRSDTVELETIHPFSLNFSADTKSITKLFEVEYNPPKKKSCFRLKTPKLTSCSESSLPYHTKVGLHEGIFQPDSKGREAQEAERIIREGVSKFCSNKETQCSKEDFRSHMYNSDVIVINLTEESDEGCVNAFPKAKVDSRRSENSEETDSQAASPILEEELYYPIFGNREHYVSNKKRGWICKVSSDSYDTNTSSGGTPSRPSPLKKRFTRNKISPGKKIPSSEAKRMRSTREFLAKNSPDASQPHFQKSVLQGIREESYKHGKQEYITPPNLSYVTYRLTAERLKSSPIHGEKKTPVPFGPTIVNNFEKSQPHEDRFNFYNTSEPSEDDKRFEHYYGVMDSDTSGSYSRNSGLWSRLLSCFQPMFSFLSR